MKRDDMLTAIQKPFADANNAAYETWSDSYLRDWLKAHHVIKTDTEQTRDSMLASMKDNYFSTSDYGSSLFLLLPLFASRRWLPSIILYLAVWSTWTESQLRDWLVSNNIIKTDAQLTRDKVSFLLLSLWPSSIRSVAHLIRRYWLRPVEAYQYEKLMVDNYASAKSTTFSAWKDSDIRAWLVEHKCTSDSLHPWLLECRVNFPPSYPLSNYPLSDIKSDAEVTRDDMVKLISDKYHAVGAPGYLTWPDARLRAYLRVSPIWTHHS
jgi:hypothetical protein